MTATLDEHGVMTWHTKVPKHEEVNSITQWLKAWQVYTAVSLKNPALLGNPQAKLVLATQLNAYASYIMELESSGHNWLMYDHMFRKLQMACPGLTFDTIDYELKDKCSAASIPSRKPSSVSQPVAKAPSSSKPPTNAKAQFPGLAQLNVPKGFCYAFLEGQVCAPGCLYKHRCPWCITPHNIHRAAECPQVAATAHSANQQHPPSAAISTHPVNQYPSAMGLPWQSANHTATTASTLGSENSSGLGTQTHSFDYGHGLRR